MSATFCAVCWHPSPGHEPNCPVLTGEPQPGIKWLTQQHQMMAAAQQQTFDGHLSQLGGSMWGTTKFVGGPLEGRNPTHPMMNYILRVDGHPEGHYEMFQFPPQLAEGKYHWILDQQKPI